MRTQLQQFSRKVLKKNLLAYTFVDMSLFHKNQRRKIFELTENVELLIYLVIVCKIRKFFLSFHTTFIFFCNKKWKNIELSYLFLCFKQFPFARRAFLKKISQKVCFFFYVNFRYTCNLVWKLILNYDYLVRNTTFGFFNWQKRHVTFL